jgi:hypothetical protein
LITLFFWQACIVEPLQKKLTLNGCPLQGHATSEP